MFFLKKPSLVLELNTIVLVFRVFIVDFHLLQYDDKRFKAFCRPILVSLRRTKSSAYCKQLIFACFRETGLQAPFNSIPDRSFRYMLNRDPLREQPCLVPIFEEKYFEVFPFILMQLFNCKYIF